MFPLCNYVDKNNIIFNWVDCEGQSGLSVMHVRFDFLIKMEAFIQNVSVLIESIKFRWLAGLRGSRICGECIKLARKWVVSDGWRIQYVLYNRVIHLQLKTLIYSAVLGNKAAKKPIINGTIPNLLWKVASSSDNHLMLCFRFESVFSILLFTFLYFYFFIVQKFHLTWAENASKIS